MRSTAGAGHGALLRSDGAGRLGECREECAVFGIHAPGEDVARLTYFGLFALQHRGQESAGIAIADGERIQAHSDMGLVQQVFDEELLQSLQGDTAIGHTRYSTTGSSHHRNAQPVVIPTGAGTIALAHNGNLVNSAQLRHDLFDDGPTSASTTDSSIMARLVAQRLEQRGDLEAAIADASRRWQGAYSVACMTANRLVATRDPSGIRPLCIGTLNSRGHVVASETCGLNVVGAEFLREIEPGEMVVMDAHGLRSVRLAPATRPAMCVFEFIYFARPDSHIYGMLLHEARRRMGHRLAAEHPVEADLVIPVPDTGWPAAIGFAEASGIPFGQALIKNRYIARTFIQPDQRQRELGVRLKLTVMREVVAGKRVVVVDDSIVRGTTKRELVSLIRRAGASEIHVRIAAPPYRYPCFYGVDTSDRSELLAARLEAVDDIRRVIGADTLGYQTVEGLLDAIGLPRERFCLACFNGDYPIAVPDEVRARKFALETEPATEPVPRS
ncbi:MAG TPA: amidophosphoribosyltransferase [Armatimonadota bacterium]|nr:amidophosphoribosyltransferase [Armatimonadota bacterium]